MAPILEDAASMEPGREDREHEAEIALTDRQYLAASMEPRREDREHNTPLCAAPATTRRLNGTRP